VIYRTVLAVLLATALLAVSLPALDDARQERAATAVATDIDALQRAAGDLLAADDPTDGAGARRVFTFRLPARQWTNAGIEQVTITPRADGTPASVSWRVDGDRTMSRPLPGLPLQTPTGAPLRLQSQGRHRLVLALSGTPGSPVVTVRRLK